MFGWKIEVFQTHPTPFFLEVHNDQMGLLEKILVPRPNREEVILIADQYRRMECIFYLRNGSKHKRLAVDKAIVWGFKGAILSMLDRAWPSSSPTPQGALHSFLQVLFLLIISSLSERWPSSSILLAPSASMSSNVSSAQSPRSMFLILPPPFSSFLICAEGSRKCTIPLSAGDHISRGGEEDETSAFSHHGIVVVGGEDSSQVQVIHVQGSPAEISKVSLQEFMGAATQLRLLEYNHPNHHSM